MTTYVVRDRVVVITGATGGLGCAAAKALRDKGAKLALLDVDQYAVDTLVQELGGPEHAVGLVANARSLESLKAAMSAANEYFGRIDTVIAGAGIAFNNSLEAMTPDEFDTVIDINLNGVWRTFRAALPYVRETKGYLLAISSMAAFIHSPMNTHYAASKAGVWALCNSTRLELKHEGIDVGSFHPTFFKTPMMDALTDGLCSTLVWNNHEGLWKFVDLDEVITELIDCIEQRSGTVTVPRRNKMVSWAPGLARKLAERIGFNPKRIAKAMELQKEPLR